MAQAKAPTAAAPIVPDGYVSAPSTAIEESQPTFSSSDDFAAYTKKWLSLNTTDLNAITADLRPLYGRIIAAMENVSTSAVQIHRMKKAIPLFDCELEKWAKSHAKDLFPPSAPPLALSDLGRTGMTLQEQKIMMQNQLHLKS
jgi:hypothetical protein